MVFFQNDLQNLLHSFLNVKAFKVKSFILFFWIGREGVCKKCCALKEETEINRKIPKQPLPSLPELSS